MESVTRRLTEALSFMGAHTIIACRSEERARQVSDKPIASPAWIKGRRLSLYFCLGNTVSELASYTCMLPYAGCAI